MAPACSLSQKGFFSSSRRVVHAGLDGADLQGAKGSATGISLPPTCCFNLSHIADEGQPGSVGRTRRKGSDALGESFPRRGENADRAGIAPKCFKNLRRFMRAIGFSGKAYATSLGKFSNSPFAATSRATLRTDA